MQFLTGFAASLVGGLFLGILNWIFWTHWTKSFLQQSPTTPKWGKIFAQSLAKLVLLGSLLWFLITRHYVKPSAFLIGFSCTVIVLIVKGLSTWEKTK